MLGAYWELAAIVESLRRERQRQGLSLGDVAKRSGIDKAALSRLEGGQNVNPTWNTLIRYAAALGKKVVMMWRELPAPDEALGQDASDTTANRSLGTAPKSQPRRRKRQRGKLASRFWIAYDISG